MHRTGAAMSVAALDRPCVGLDKTESTDRQSQEIGGDLRKAGFMALAVRLRAEHQDDTAISFEADLGALARRAARRLKKTRDAEPAQPAALRSFLASCRKAFAQDAPRHLIEIGGKPSAIDRDAEPAAIRELVDQIAPAQCHPIARQPARGMIDESLDQVIGFGLAGAAISVDRDGVGEK